MSTPMSNSSNSRLSPSNPTDLDKRILALLLAEIKRQQITRVDLASRLGCTTSAVGQVLGGKHAISLRTVERYLSVLGKKLEMKLDYTQPRIYHHYFPGDGKAFSEDYDPAMLQTGCGVPVERGHVTPELNHATCEACLRAYRERKLK